MSKEATIKVKKSLVEFLNSREKGLEDISKNKETKHQPNGHLNIQIINNQITIWDYTHGDKYKLLLALLQKGGIKMDIKTESWCG